LTTPNTYSVAINQKRCQIKAAKGRKRRKSIVAQILSLILLTLIRSFASYGNNKMKPAMTELVDKKWNKQYEKLVEFKRKHGNCLVTSRYQEDMSLGAWVSKQRNVHISNKLRLDRKGLLDEIGFVWGRVDKSFSDEFESRWKTQYEKLVDFKRKHGNCLVPRSYQKDLSFGKWVNTQRQLHVNNTIRTGRKDALDQLGFAWKAPRGAANNKNNNKNWHQQYEKLVDFKRKHGNCIVPRSYEEDVAFGNWVHNQRQRHNRNTIRQDQKELLDEIGLVWTSVVNCSQKWNKQYEKLVEFKQKNGHCLVPYKYQEDASFGNWVWWQRGRHANNKILPYRKKLLDEIGFVWKAGTVVARSSTTNVRGLIIASFHALFRISFSLSFLFFCCF
jgi:hypothetical protein